MSKASSPSTLSIPNEIGGVRMTKQRKEVYRLLLEKKDHPTAHDIFISLQERMPSISLATVYNCLETLVEHEVLQQVNFDREPSRYCANLKEHGHFLDEKTGKIQDVAFKKDVNIKDLFDLPEDTIIENLDITIRGILPNNSTH